MPHRLEPQPGEVIDRSRLIVGQDTDCLTGGYAAGLGALIKPDKPDGAGLPELRWHQASPGSGDSRLVGLRTLDPDLVPTEGSQLLDADGRICGRVASSRRSPTLGRSVCLARVLVGFANPGTRVSVRLRDGSSATASVTEGLAQVDPEGVRARG